MAMHLKLNDEPVPLADINPTPLIDVLLVLLIILIIALPLSTHRTSLDLPREGSGQSRPSVTVEIDFDGSLYWNDIRVSDLAKLEEYFRSIAREPLQPNVLINANHSAHYDMVAKVLATAQKNGVQRLGFVGQERFTE